MKTEILILKSKLCGFEHISKKISAKITTLKGEKRQAARVQKKLIGQTSREHQIAYGLIRSVPYSLIENKCRMGNDPNCERILEIILAHSSFFAKREWSITRVKTLLKREESL